MTARFNLGRVVITRNALDTLPGDALLEGLARHARGDWGDVCPEDRGLNDRALREGSRLLSVYKTGDGTAFWIITEADRSATTILLPEDY